MPDRQALRERVTEAVLDFQADLMRALDLSWVVIALIWAMGAIPGLVLAAATYHRGVTVGLGDAVQTRDEARVSRDYCSEAVDAAQETAYAILAAQETLRAMHGHETAPTYAEEDR